MDSTDSFEQAMDDWELGRIKMESNSQNLEESNNDLVNFLDEFKIEHHERHGKVFRGDALALGGLAIVGAVTFNMDNPNASAGNLVLVSLGILAGFCWSEAAKHFQQAKEERENEFNPRQQG